MKLLTDSCDVEDQIWPPGFRFHPTDEELLLYYLKRKISRRKLKLDVIRVADVYKFDPEELPAQSVLKTGDRQWFFFSPRDRKYPHGGRSSRATAHGYWKATGKDRNITCNSRTAGVKKTLVFYRGRAPHGGRTDWVMHEYILDEEELKRCQNVKDYYILYKLYKKSGPGPKNGEQYGAPFREEDWADEEDVKCLINPGVSSEDLANSEDLAKIKPINVVGCNGQLQSNAEDVVQQIANGTTHPQPQVVAHNYRRPEVTGEEEPQSAVVDPSSMAVVFPAPVSPPNSIVQQAGFDFNHSATSKLETFDVLEVTSSMNQSDQMHQICEVGFLEMYDLLGPEATISTTEQPVQNIEFGDLNGIGEFDLYHDAAMFLQDMGPIDQGALSQAYPDMFRTDPMNQIDFQLQPELNRYLLDNQSQFHSSSEGQSYQLQFQSAGNLPDNQMQHSAGIDQSIQLWMCDQKGACEMDQNSQLRMHDQRSDVFSPEASLRGNLSQQESGLTPYVNQSEGEKGKGGAPSQFSSAMWDFLDSVPAAPASAAEGPLVNLPFERIRLSEAKLSNIRKTDDSAENDDAKVRRARGRRRFFFISVFVALCAILWMLVGSTRPLGMCIYP